MYLIIIVIIIIIIITWWGRAIWRYDQAYLDCTRKILESYSLKYQIAVADKE